MDISIAVTSYNRPKTLWKCLDSINAGKWDFASKVVIDDGSSEEFHSQIMEACRISQFDLLVKKQQAGIGNSNNLAFIASASRYVIYLADDVLVHLDEEWLREIEAGFNAGFYYIEIISSRQEQPITVLRAIDKSVISEMGWYDERFFFWCEDNDFVIRMRQALKTNRIFPKYKDGLITHFHEPTEKTVWKFRSSEGTGREFFLKKWEISDVFRRRFPYMTDSEIIQYAHLPGHVIRKMDEPDFYPEAAERYSKKDFSSYLNLASIKKYHEFQQKE